MVPGADAATGSAVPVSDDLVELLTVTQRRLARGVGAVLAEDGSTLDGYRLLRCLNGPGGRSMGELAATLHLPPPTLTRLVDGAVDAALAYRLPDPEDGRKVVVHLSAAGQVRLARLEALVRSHEDALARSLGGERVSALVRALADLAVGED